MKKISFVLFLFLFQNIFCQEYHFDRLIQYKETSVTFTGSRLVIIFFNSKNTSYYFINSSWNEEVNGYLIDNNLNITHSFINKNINENNDYHYLYSKKFNPDNCTIDCSRISIEESINAGQFSKIVMINHVNKKKKKKDYEIEVISKPFDFAILKPLIKILQHHFLFCEELKVPENNIPTSIKLISGKHIKAEQKLELVKTIDINFFVDKEKIKYN